MDFKFWTNSKTEQIPNFEQISKFCEKFEIWTKINFDQKSNLNKN
jgi:hypothetical protein